VTLQDLGSIGEVVAAIATVMTLGYLAIQVRHNTRGLDQNNDLLRLSYENHVREEGTQLRALLAGDAELASIWRRGLAAEDLERIERDRFELLIINVINMLGAQHDALGRGLAQPHIATYLYFVARTPGFRQWWARHREQGSSAEFRRWVDSLTQPEPRGDGPAA